MEDQKELESGVVLPKVKGELLMQLLALLQFEGGRDGEVPVKLAELDVDGVREGEVCAERE